MVHQLAPQPDSSDIGQDRSNIARSGDRYEGAGLAGVAAEDGFAGRCFYEMEDGQGEENQDGVGEPGV